ncbi:MAG: hypothetical protein SGBAC_007914 [Bacillariaceae sp.]
MGKKNKGKKRATQRLYEAARKAQKLTNIGECGEPHAHAYQHSSRVEAKQEMEEAMDSDAHHATNASVNRISDTDLENTIRTLEVLTATPQSIEMVRHSKRFKQLRRYLHPLVVQQLKTYDKGIDYRHRTTAHLAQQEYGSALTSLQACADLEQIPKQGTIQRWVREVDSCAEGNLKISLLSRILMLGDSQQDTTGKSKNTIHPAQDLEDDYEGLNKHDPEQALLQAQQGRNQQLQRSEHQPHSANTTASGITILDSWNIPSENANADETVEKVEATNGQTEPTKFKSLILFREKAEERTPPNHFDLHLHYVIPIDDTDCILSQSRNGTTRNIAPSVCKVPFLSGARVLQNVFTDEECSRLMQMATTLGYRPDHPRVLAEPTALQNLLFERVKNLLPATSHDLQSQMGDDSQIGDESGAELVANGNGDRGGKPCFELNSINKRWRFFRYGQGCVYRPHIDGSWPESKLVRRSKDDVNNDDGTMNEGAGNQFCQRYKYDTDASGETRSFLTFLIYLNDDFEGGATRFYQSDKESSAGDKSNGMVAQGVQPKKGCVLVFPQGNTASLLHEGSAVTKGTKYVVRSDVLYRRKSTKQ